MFITFIIFGIIYGTSHGVKIVTQIDPSYVFGFVGPYDPATGIELTYFRDPANPYDFNPLLSENYVNFNTDPVPDVGSPVVTGLPNVPKSDYYTGNGKKFASNVNGWWDHYRGNFYRRVDICTGDECSNGDFCEPFTPDCSPAYYGIFGASRVFELNWYFSSGVGSYFTCFYYCLEPVPENIKFRHLPSIFSNEELASYEFIQSTTLPTDQNIADFNTFLTNLPRLSVKVYPYDTTKLTPNFNFISKNFFFMGDSRMVSNQGLFRDINCEAYIGEDFLNRPEYGSPTDTAAIEPFVLAASGQSYSKIILADNPGSEWMTRPRNIGDDQIIFHYEGINFAFAAFPYKLEYKQYSRLLDIMTSSKFLQLRYGAKVSDGIISYGCPGSEALGIFYGTGKCKVICDGKVVLEDEATQIMHPIRLQGSCTTTCKMGSVYLCYKSAKPRRVLMVRSPASTFKDKPHGVKQLEYQERWCSLNPICQYYSTPMIYPSDGLDANHGSVTMRAFTCQALLDGILFKTSGLPVTSKYNDRFVPEDYEAYNIQHSVPYLNSRPFPTDLAFYETMPYIVLFRITKDEKFYKIAVSSETKRLTMVDVCQQMPDFIRFCELTVVNEGSAVYDFTLSSTEPYALAKISFDKLESSLSGSLISIRDLSSYEEFLSPPRSCLAYYDKDCEILYYHNGYGLAGFSYKTEDEVKYCYEEFDFTTDNTLLKTCVLPFDVVNEKFRERLSDIKATGVPGDHTANVACFRGSCELGVILSTPSIKMVSRFCCRHLEESQTCDIKSQVDYDGITLDFKANNAKFTYNKRDGEVVSGFVAGSTTVKIPSDSPGTYNVYVTCGSSRDLVVYTHTELSYCKSSANKFGGDFGVWFCVNYNLTLPASILLGILITMMVFNKPYDYILGIIFYIPARIFFGVFGNGKENILSQRSHQAANNLGKLIRYFISSGFFIVIISLLSLTKRASASDIVENIPTPHEVNAIVEKLWSGAKLDGFSPTGAYLSFSESDGYSNINYKVSDKYCDSTSCTGRPTFTFPGPFELGEQWHFKADHLDIVLKIMGTNVITRVKHIYKTCATTVKQNSASTCQDSDCSACKSEVLLDVYKSANYYFRAFEDVATWACAGSCVALDNGCSCFICTNVPTKDCGDVYEVVDLQAVLTVCMGINGKAYCANITQSIDTDNIISKVYVSNPTSQRFFKRNNIYYKGEINAFGSYSNKFGAIQIVDGQVYGTHDPDPVERCVFGHERTYRLNRCFVDTYYLYENLEQFPVLSVSSNTITSFYPGSIYGEFSITFPSMTVSGGRSNLIIDSLNDLSCSGCIDCAVGLVCAFVIQSPGSGIVSISSACTVSPSKLSVSQGMGSFDLRFFCQESDLVEGQVSFKIGEVEYKSLYTPVEQVGPVVRDDKGIVHKSPTYTLKEGVYPTFTWKWWYTAIIVSLGIVIVYIAFMVITRRHQLAGFLQSHANVVNPSDDLPVAFLSRRGYKKII